ncbi:MAG: hypothetical protein WC269_03290 [Candidatus Gracilibacteria bacterium]|jgi:hypothetical protein
MRKPTKQKGSIALISVVIVSAILIILVLGISETQISTSYQYLNSASSKDLYYSAEACLEEAIFRTEENTSYTGGILDLGTESCTISTSGTSSKTISITVTSENYTQNFEALINVTTNGQANNVELLNWTKI